MAYVEPKMCKNANNKEHISCADLINMWWWITCLNQGQVGHWSYSSYTGCGSIYQRPFSIPAYIIELLHRPIHLSVKLGS